MSRCGSEIADGGAGLPAYIYDLPGLRRHAAAIGEALSGSGVELFYAAKANPEPAMLRAARGVHTHLASGLDATAMLALGEQILAWARPWLRANLPQVGRPEIVLGGGMGAFEMAGAYAWNVSHHDFLMHPKPTFHLLDHCVLDD